MKEKVTELLRKTPVVEYAKIAVMLVGFGIAIGRMEYKFNSGIEEVKGLMREHIIESKGKEALYTQRLEFLEDKVAESMSVDKTISDFLRPDDVSIRRRKR